MQRRFAGKQGFTLFELLVVLVVIGLMSAMVVPRLSGYLSTLELKTAAKRTAAILRWARNKAAMEKVVVLVEIDIENRKLNVFLDENRSRSIKSVEKTETRQEPPAPTATYLLSDGIFYASGEEPARTDDPLKMNLFFYPNGSCSGGTLIVANQKEKQYNLYIDRFTGDVVMEG